MMPTRSTAGTRRGQPLGVLLALIVGWAAIRVVTWQSPFPILAPLKAYDAPIAHANRSTDESTPVSAPVLGAAADTPAAPLAPGWSTRALPASVPGALLPASTGDTTNRDSTSTAAAQQLLFMAGMAYVPVPPELSSALASASRSANPGKARQAPQRGLSGNPALDRWRLDAWSYYRAGSGVPPVVAGAPYPATYGGSQAGAVLHYTIDGSARRPELYLRATATPDQPRQSEVAIGFGARPLAKVPLRAQAELRAFNQSGRTELRPAVAAVTEIAPVKIPLEFVGEGYAQAGYVAGSFATGFVDGQLRIERPVITGDAARFRLGGGAWGGGQKGAARLDVGPSATLDLSGGPVPLRLSADYRIRAAGDAMPKSGVAITLSSGF
ncbi:hypothetical protein [Tsuneonella mangrovi]|uniref:hypothetical protein n=1 Tax=Tsuneonella mangrovi TaxID=1982042 RepID=UPI000BA1DA42|nr:hypothetical protein [Tsuneonella mangrovi]